jgi:hypothetical protein
MTIKLDTYAKRLGTNKIVFLFGPTTNILAMGVTTQGHAACFVVKKPI